MEVLGGLVLSLVALVLLAGIGITTLAAFAIMATLGLLTDMSFKRVFFVSFAMGLAAPLLVGGATLAALEDGSLERDLRDGLGEVVIAPDREPGNWAEIGDQLEELEQDIEAGDMSDAEIEQRIEGLIEQSTGVQLDLKGVAVNGAGDALRVQID